MSEDKSLVVKGDGVQLGSLVLANPEQVVASATAIATELGKIIDRQKLASIVSGKKFVRVEGWTTLGALLGVIPVEVSNDEEDGIFTAVVELRRMSDGAVVGRASAECGSPDELDRKREPTWANRARYARKSMAATRATGKAFRLSFSWIMSLAGYEVTPWEEMEGVIEGDYKDVAPKEPPKKRRVERPMEPKKLRELLEKKAGSEHLGKSGTEKQRQFLVGLINQCLGISNDVSAKQARYAVCEWLTGHARSGAIPGPFVNAMMDWMNPDENNNPDLDACKEINAVYKEILREQGQTEFAA